jgi:hypothetical protein
MARNDSNRPDVLNSASETQMEELDRQFEEGDRDAWKALTDSYGWSAEQSRAVWNWFGADPEKTQK